MSNPKEDQIILLKNIGRTFKMMTMTISDEMDRHDLDVTREQGMVLRSLNIRDGIIQNELAWVTFRDKTSLARLLGRMEKSGFIQRKTDQRDKRAKRVFITTRGRKLLNKINKVLTEMNKKFQKGLTKKQVASTVEALQMIQKNLDNHFEI